METKGIGVYKKLHQIQQRVTSLTSDAKGQTGAATYNYISGSKVLGIIRPAMDEIGVILSQEVIGIENKPIMYMAKNGEKTEMFTTVHVRFTWIDVEDGSAFPCEFYANGMNAFDKGLGSALTYAERYFLLKFFHIATDEDDVDAIVRDGEAEAKPNNRRGRPSTRSQQAAPQPQAAPVPQPAPAPAKKVIEFEGRNWEWALRQIGKGEDMAYIESLCTMNVDTYNRLSERVALAKDLNIGN